MYKTSTSDGKVSDYNKFAKIFTVKEKTFGDADWYNKQIVFRVIQASPYQGYREEGFMLSIFNTDSTADSKIDLINLPKADIKTREREFTCKYIKTNNEIAVYVNSVSDGVPVHVYVDYVSNIGFFDFYYGEPFETVNNLIDCVNNNEDIVNINMLNSWTKNSDAIIDESYRNGEVNISFGCTSGQLSNGTTSIAIAKITSTDYRPKNDILVSCAYRVKDSRQYKTCACIVTKYGDILTFINEATDRLHINFRYNV